MARSSPPQDGHEGTAGLRARVAELEARLAQREAEAARLRDSETRYRHLVEHSLGLICTHDAQGLLLSINPAAARALEYEPEEMIGQPISTFLSPRVRQYFTDYLARVFGQGVDQGLMVVATRGGDELIWAYRNVRIDQPGGPAYVLGHAQDITAVERAREAIARARTEMRERVRERTAELMKTNRRLRSELGEHELIEESLRRSRTRLELLNEIVVGATGMRSRTGVIKRAVESMSGHFPGARVFFGRLSEAADIQVVHQAPQDGEGPDRSSPDYRWPAECLDSLRRGDAVLVQDASSDERMRGYRGAARAILAVPVRRDDEVKGLIGLTAAGPLGWTEYDVETVREIAGYLSLALRDS